MPLDCDKLDDAVLALLNLGLHDGMRAWKGFDWGVMDRLFERGFIHDPKGKAKSVEFTPEGLTRSERLLIALFGENSSAEGDVVALYFRLLDRWNQRQAKEMAALFAADGRMVGFDGSTASGPIQIESHLSPVFAHHPTPEFIGKVRGVRVLPPGAAILSAVAGMIPRGQADLNPALNAIQSLVAVREEGEWRIAQFQNTPAAFHGRPEDAEALTQELRQVLRESPRVV